MEDRWTRSLSLLRTTELKALAGDVWSCKIQTYVMRRKEDISLLDATRSRQVSGARWATPTREVTFRALNLTLLYFCFHT